VFEEYLQDSYEFWIKAEQLARESKEREAKRYYRASIFYAAGAIEAFINYIVDSFTKASNIEHYELAFLNDKALYFSADKGLTERVEFHKIDDKIRVLMRRFSPSFDYKSVTWNKFMEFKKMRDSLIHPRHLEDEIKIADYRKKTKEGLRAIIEIMNYVSKGVFRKSLRKKILDLIPE
jgi:hypothetical protein